MGRKGITSDDVVRAYVALLKQGRTPGPRNLRLEIGRGSYTTISQHLRRLAFRQIGVQAMRLAVTGEGLQNARSDRRTARLEDREADRR